MRRRLLWLLGGFVLSALNVRAHPVAQGAIDIVVSADHIEAKVRVSNEEAFVAE